MFKKRSCRLYTIFMGSARLIKNLIESAESGLEKSHYVPSSSVVLMNFILRYQGMYPMAT